MRFFVGIILVCLLGSCASVNKGVFIKRKYNKGYYVNVATHKRSVVVKENNSNRPPFILPELKHETTEIALVEDNDTKPSANTVSKIEGQKAISSLPDHNTLSFSNSFKAQNKVLEVKERLSVQVQKQRSSISDTQIGIGLVLFLLLTVIYTFAILINNPAFPVLLAIPIAMIGALLTLLTGVMFI